MTKALFDEPRPAGRRARGGQGHRRQEHALEGIAGAAASGRREVLPRSRPDQVEPGRTAATRRPTGTMRRPDRARRKTSRRARRPTRRARAVLGAHWRWLAGVALAFSTYQLVIAAFSPLSQPGHALAARRLPAGARLPDLSGLATAPSCRGIAAGTTGCWPARAFALGALPLGVRGRPDPALGRPEHAPTWSSARPSSSWCSRRRAACSGLALPIICARVPAYGLFGQYLPATLAHRGYGFDQIVGAALPRHRGHLRHPDAGLGDLHLPVHPVRRLPRTRRHDRPVQRPGAGPRRPHPGRPGQGGGDLVGADGHDLRLRASPTC